MCGGSINSKTGCRGRGRFWRDVASSPPAWLISAIGVSEIPMPSLVLLLLGAGRLFYPTHLLRQVVRHRFENLKLPWSSCLRSSTSDA